MIMQKAIDNALFNIITNVLSVIIASIASLWMTPFLLERLGVEGYGVVALFLSFTMYFNLATTVLSASVGRFVSLSYFKDDIKNASTYMSSSLWGMGIISGILIIFSLFFIMFLGLIF